MTTHTRQPPQLATAFLWLLGALTILAAFDTRVDSMAVADQHVLRRIGSMHTALFSGHSIGLLGMGLGAGLLGGMIGMGGGVLKVAGLLLLFNLDIYFARAVSLTTMFFTTASAAFVHLKRGAGTFRLMLPMLPMSLIGLMLGILLGNAMRGSVLTHLFGFFLLFLSLTTLIQLLADPVEHGIRADYETKSRSIARTRAGGGIGGLHGLVCGLLGISGGVLATPMQQLMLSVPIRDAIANTLVVSAFCTGIGSFVVIATGIPRGDFTLNEILFAIVHVGVGALVGAQLGARASRTVSVPWLKFLFVALSFGAALSILL